MKITAEETHYFVLSLLSIILTVLGLVEVFSVCILDSHKYFRKQKPWVIAATSTFGFLCGVVLCTQVGALRINVPIFIYCENVSATYFSQEFSGLTFTTNTRVVSL